MEQIDRESFICAFTVRKLKYIVSHLYVSLMELKSAKM
jgi:hypothetical protein